MANKFAESAESKEEPWESLVHDGEVVSVSPLLRIRLGTRSRAAVGEVLSMIAGLSGKTRFAAVFTGLFQWVCFACSFLSRCQG